MKHGVSFSHMFRIYSPLKAKTIKIKPTNKDIFIANMTSLHDNYNHLLHVIRLFEDQNFKQIGCK